eukprot:gene14407-30675_t
MSTALAEQEGGSDISGFRKPDTGDVDVMDLNPCCSLLCCIASCYTVYPDCLGCSGSQVCCCIANQMVTLKKSKNPDACCLLIENKTEIIPVRVCLKARTQCFCCDIRASLPCDVEIPCLMTVFFLTCCYRNKCNVKCCSKIGTIDNDYQQSS